MNQEEGIRKGKKRKRSGKERTRSRARARARARARRGKKKIANLPADIILSEILPRLPASSLLRLRLVCKAWQSVILDPAFAYANLKCALDRWHASHRVMINYYRKGKLVLLDEELRRPKAVMETHSHVAPPCNGLFCIYMQDYHEKYDKCTLQLFNPTTRELLPLRRPNNSQFWNFYLVFDPSVHKYKVVCHPNSRLECQVLTIGIDTCWRHIESFDSQLVTTKRRSAVIGGYLFRVMRDSESLHNVAVLFDPCEEKFRRLFLPNWIEEVFDVQGKPCFVEDYGTSIFTRGLHLWMLMDLDREVWIHKCIMPAIGRDQVQIRGYPDTIVFSHLVFISEEKLLLFDGGQFYYLHLQSGGRNVDWEEVRSAGDDQVKYHHAYAFAYVGSLISLKHMLTSTA